MVKCNQAAGSTRYSIHFGWNNQQKTMEKQNSTQNCIVLLLLQQLSLLKPIACLENLQLRDLKCKTINIMFVEKLAKHAIIKLQRNRNSFVLPILYTRLYVCVCVVCARIHIRTLLLLFRHSLCYSQPCSWFSLDFVFLLFAAFTRRS